MPWVINKAISWTILAWLGRRTPAGTIQSSSIAVPMTIAATEAIVAWRVQMGQMSFVSDLEANVLDGSETLADTCA